MKIKITSIFVFILMTSFVLHKYYVSVSEINFNDKNKRLEVALKVFNDDWQNALDRRLGKPVLLGSKNEFAKMDSLIQAYVKDHYAINVNGENIPISYLGHEMEDEATWIYFYTSEIDDKIVEVEIFNSVLTELFDEQRNIVQIKINGLSRSGFFTKSRNKKKFYFK